MPALSDLPFRAVTPTAQQTANDFNQVMSDDPSSSASSLAALLDDRHDDLPTTPPAEETEPGSASGAGHQRSSSRERQGKLNRKRAELLDHLIRSLDAVIFCELVVVYYMEYAPQLLPQKPPSPTPHQLTSHDRPQLLVPALPATLSNATLLPDAETGIHTPDAQADPIYRRHCRHQRARRPPAHLSGPPGGRRRSDAGLPPR